MRVINDTHWQTRQIKSIFARVNKKLGKKVAAPPYIVILYAGNRVPYSGYKTGLTLNRAKTAVLKDYDPTKPPSTTKVHVLHLPRSSANPVLVARSASHLFKSGSTLSSTGLRAEAQSLQDFDWASTFTLETKPKPKPLSRDEKLEAELANAQKRIKSWVVKQKLAGTKLRKWRKLETRLKYRIKKLAEN